MRENTEIWGGKGKKKGKSEGKNGMRGKKGKVEGKQRDEEGKRFKKKVNLREKQM